jgi:hypothetical protein
MRLRLAARSCSQRKHESILAFSGGTTSARCCSSLNGFEICANYDCLNMDWTARVYLNAPWFGYFFGFIKKAVEEIQRHLDALYYIVVPTRPSINYLLKAHGVNGITVAIRSLGRPPWKHTETGKPHPSPLPAMAIILRRGSVSGPDKPGVLPEPPSFSHRSA